MDNSDAQLTQIAVLMSDLKNLTLQVNKLEAKLDAYASHFVTSEVYELKHREVELHIQTLDARMEGVGKYSSTKNWILATSSASAGVILALLIQFFLTHQGH